MKLFNSQLSIKLLAVALVLTMSACASKKSTENDAMDDANANKGSTVSTQGSDDGDLNTVSNGSSSLNGMNEMDMAQLLKKKEFFFGYDSFSVDSKSEKAVLAHGKFLAKTPTARVRVEGHTDERGTREYNLALGERRAKSVKQILLSAGAQGKQIEVITYGEERPKAQGATENAYSQNRRVDIEYTVGRP